MITAEHIELAARKPGHVVIRGRFYAWRFNYRVLLYAGSPT